MVSVRKDKPGFRIGELSGGTLWGPSSNPGHVNYFQLRCGIVLVSSGVDAFLAFYYRDHILDLERNPVCLTLMAIEPDYLSVFIVAKLITTITVVAVICYLRRRNDQMGRLVATALAAFQMGLLTYQISI